MKKYMNIIIGRRSNLSRKLHNSIINSRLVSSQKVEEEFKSIIHENSGFSFNIIFNNFQQSIHLNENTNFDNYIFSSIQTTAKVIDLVNLYELNINKLIYSSSSSVYGNNKFCTENDNVMPLSLHAALKVSNEELIKKFCKSRDIDFSITRIFNMYGGEDSFSIISKIKDAYNNNTILNVINNGTSIRDYVHIDDVVRVYTKLLDNEGLPKILNIANGNGKRLIDILNFLKNHSINIDITNSFRDELKASIANTDLLNSFMDTSDFIQVEDFLLRELY